MAESTGRNTEVTQEQPQPPTDERAFIGRDKELGAFDAALARARNSRGQVLFFSGEPGIGKTRIAQRAAETAGAAGLMVLWGRCPEEPGAPPYWPWRQAMRQCIAKYDSVVLAGLAAAATQDLAAFEPELGRKLRMPPAAAEGAAVHGRNPVPLVRRCRELLAACLRTPARAVDLRRHAPRRRAFAEAVRIRCR